MKKRLLLMALCVLTLSSCSFIPAGIEDLLVSPQLNTRQAEVDSALRATLNLDNILYKYPLSGDYRAPFVFYDLNGDTRQEAVVFYVDVGDSMNVRAKVLSETESGVWSSVYDIAGSGSDVEFVHFAPLKSAGSSCMIIGWQTPRRLTATLGVYSLEGGRVQTDVLEPYAQYLLLDGFSDGLSRLALVVEEANTGIYRISLLSRMGSGVAVVDSLPLARNVSEILQISKGKLWDGTDALYIDQMRTDSIVATEVVRLSGTGLFPITDSEEELESIYTATFRDQEVLSVDMDGDGVIEIPQLTPLPGDEFESDLPLVEYMRMTEKGFDIVARAVINYPAGYLVFYPQRWVDNVTVVRQPENNEWRFVKLDPDTLQESAELLRIRRYAAGDYRDQFSNNYFLLDQKGAFEYYAYLPRIPDEPLSLTQAEARGLFRLL